MASHAGTRATVSPEIAVAMLAELRAIRQLLEKPTLRRADREQDVWLLRAVVAAIPDCVFSSAELFAHAAVNDTLRDAFAAVGIRSARQLGKRLQRLQGHTTGGLMITRHGSDAHGAIWSISVAESEDGTLTPSQRRTSGEKMLV